MTSSTNQEGRGDAALTATLSAILDALHDMRITLKSVNDQLSGAPSFSHPPSHGQSVSGTSGSFVSELSPVIVDVSGIMPNVSRSTEIMTSASAASAASPTTSSTVAPTDPAHAISLLGAAPTSPTSLAPTGSPHVPLPITVTTTTVTTSSTPSEPTMPLGSGPDVPTPAEVTSQLQGTPSVASSRWFVVTSGLAPGVYKSWDETSPLVTGVSRAVYTKHSTKAEALTAYQTVWERGHVIRRP